MNRHTKRDKRWQGEDSGKTESGSAYKPKLINKWQGISLVNAVLTLVFIGFCYWLLAVKNGFMLRWYDEMSLFEANGFFFRQYLYFPGGLLRYAGLYLTQFMYHPFLGSTVLISLWLLIIWLARKLFSLTDTLFPLTLLLPVSLMVAVLQLDEAWLSMKAPGYVFSNTLGYLFTLCSYWAYCKAGRNWLAATIVAMLIAACYFMAGYYAILGAALCIVKSIVGSVRHRNYLHLIGPVLVLALVIWLPYLYYTYLPGNTVDNELLHLKGLPQLFIDSFDAYLWQPIIVSVALLVVYEVLSLFSLERIRYSVAVHWVMIVALFGAGIWSVAATRKNEQLRATVLMLQNIDRNEWQRASHVMSLIEEEPNYSMLVLKNLIDVVLGGDSRDLSQLGPSSSDPRHSEKFSMTAFVQVPVNYYIGRFNQSYRWAMEHTVQYGKRVFFLKYMVKDALLRGEYKLARRYNDILLGTMFHKEWAIEMARYIGNPPLIKDNDEFVSALRMSEEEQKGDVR